MGRTIERIEELYRDIVFGRGVDWVLSPRRTGKDRARLLADARGRTLEIGFGSGTNLDYYPEAVTHLSAVEFESDALRRAAGKIARCRFPVEVVEPTATELPFADDTFDTAVSMWTLCSIDHAPATLAELRRVLRPNGALIFIEHGLAPDPTIASAQRRWTPYWRRPALGCRLDKPVFDLVKAAGFSLEAEEAEYRPGPRVLSFTYSGIARNSG